MRFLVDSDWLADYLKGRREARALLDGLAADGLGISIITYAEVYEGIYFGRDAERYEAVFRQFLRAVRVVAVSRAVARQYARLRGTLRLQGQLIGQPDILIAATAITHNLELVTRNLRDFQRIPGLTIYQPSS